MRGQDKGSGWHNESQRHRLASYGIKTAHGINYSSVDGQILVSAGVTEAFQKLGTKLKTGFARAKVGIIGTEEQKEALAIARKQEKFQKEAVQTQERLEKAGVKKPQIKKAIRDIPEGKEIRARVKKPGIVTTTGVPAQVGKDPAKADVESAKRTAQKTQEFEDAIEEVTEIRGRDKTTKPIGQRTSSQHLDRSIKSVGQGGRQTRPDINVNQAMMESIDADDIIALAQNKEQLIKYTTALQHDINKIEAERKAMSDEFRNIEQTNYKTLQNSRRLQNENIKQEINNIKMSGYDKHKVHNKIKQVKIRNDSEYRGKMNVIKDQKRQHRVDLKFADDINKDLKKLHRQINKRVKMMIASGQPK